jgi:hypothetical protein
MKPQLHGFIINGKHFFFELPLSEKAMRRRWERVVAKGKTREFLRRQAKKATAIFERVIR